MDGINLNTLGFRGDIRWVYNEEGSGTKFYNSSMYFPDSLTKPQTNSGITIDPGLDLGNAERELIYEVLNFYSKESLLTTYQGDALRHAIGLTGKDAIGWFNNNKLAFKNKFLVPDLVAMFVLVNHTAPDYWQPLTAAMPALLKMRNEKLKCAVHTALLSLSYNKGSKAAISAAKEFAAIGSWDGLAKKIKSIRQRTEALKNRRRREAELIFAALKHKGDFIITLDGEINPMPVTAIPHAYSEYVVEKLGYELKLDPNFKIKI